MIRIAAVVLGLCVSMGALAQAQAPAPQAYTMKAVGTFFDRELTVTIVRDGARERVERKLAGRASVSLYDFATHRVYWIGWSGAGSCSSGRYLSARAPVDEDPVTGTPDHLPKLADGRSRKAAGSGTIAGMPARIEAFVGAKKPSGRSASGRDERPRPTRVWLAEQGGFLLKLEAEAPDGKPVTLLEVTELTFEQPASSALLEPPAECVSTDSEMDDSGLMRARAQATVTAQASGTANLDAGTTSGTGSVSMRAEGQGEKPRPAGAPSKIEELTVSVVEQPHGARCGTKLQVTGTIAVDGPAVIKYRLLPSSGGLQFPDGPSGTVTVDGAGNATLVRDAVPPRSVKGVMRLQATVQGTKGRDGPMKTSAAVPYDVTCRR